MTEIDLTFKEKEIDTAEFIEEVNKLPDKYRERIFYMMKGCQLICNNHQDKEIA